MYKNKPKRLSCYDYSLPAYYFVTICTKNHIELFGNAHNHKVKLSSIGKIIESNLIRISQVYPSVKVDQFVIMPNHLHIIFILEDVDDALNATSTNDYDRSKMLLSKVIQSFKSSCTKEIKCTGFNNQVWQRSFYDRIIRNETELYRIRKYISENPLKWQLEKKDISENIDNEII